MDNQIFAIFALALVVLFVLVGPGVEFVLSTIGATQKAKQDSQRIDQILAGVSGLMSMGLNALERQELQRLIRERIRKDAEEPEPELH